MSSTCKYHLDSVPCVEYKTIKTDIGIRSVLNTPDDNVGENKTGANISLYIVFLGEIYKH